MACRLAWHANVHGVRPREEELRSATSGFPVVALQEIGFRRVEEAQNCFQRLWPDHRLVGCFPHDDQGVGCALLVHRHLHWRAPFSHSACRHRLLGVELRLGGRWLRVSSLYVPPATSGHPLDPQLLADGLGAPLAVLLGDLNARSAALGCRTTNAHGRALEDFLLDASEDGAVVLNDPSTPTFSHNSADFVDTLDWVLATPRASLFLGASLGRDVGSDHLPLEVSTTTPVLERRRTSGAPRWRTSALSRDDWASFEVEVESELLDAGFVPAPDLPSTPADLDVAAERLEAALQRAADTSLCRSRPRSDTARLPLPWPLVLLVRERNRLRRQLARHGQSGSLRRLLAEVRADLRRQLETFRRQRLLDKARLFAAGPKREGLQFWGRVRAWFRGANQHLPPLQLDDLGPATTPAERAEVFARHLERALGGDSHASFDDDFRREVEDDVGSDSSLRPLDALPDDAVDGDDPTRSVTAEEVHRELRRLHSGKAPGPDGLSSDLLRHCPFSAAVVLARLFSASLALGYVPACWRLSFVRLLPKPGKQLTRPADFRPISLCSVVGKVLERLFARRLSIVLEERGLLPEEQSAFRPARGTEEQLCLVAQRAVQAANGGLATTLVALDVYKAYDSVWHEGLLCRLRTSTSAPTARWVASFLRGRQAAVLEDGHVSRRFSTLAGVPQGSPLSPALFNFYTAEMPLPRGRLVGASLYADDLALWASASSPTTALQLVRPHLDRVVQWGRRWRLRFNPEKTQVGFFSRRPRWPSQDLQPPVLLGTQLSWADHVDLLGLRLDLLLLLPHAQRLASRLGPRCLDLRRWSWAFPSVPAWVGVLLFKTLIRPALTYGGTALLLACPTARERLRRIERQGLRAALRRGLDTPIQQLYDAARCGEVDGVVRAAARRCLLRAAETRNSRLLAASLAAPDSTPTELAETFPWSEPSLFSTRRTRRRYAQLSETATSRPDPPTPSAPGAIED